MRFTVNLHKNLVQMPLPVRICAHLADPFLANLCGKQWTKAVPAKSNRFMADVDAALKKNIFDLPQRQRIANLHHDRESDDLGRTVG